MDMVSQEEDLELRQASIDWLKGRTQDGLNPIHAEELANDFYFNGGRRALKNPQAGIHSSRGYGAAWTITTTYRADGVDRPYDDAPGDDGLLRYKWQGADAESPNNKALRKSMELRLPLIWFWGIRPSVYKAIFPVYLIAEEPDRRQFVVATDGLQNLESAGEGASELLKEYRIASVRARVHQPIFRERLLHAYRTQCTVCAMPHAELIDAAHIVPDKEPDGIPTVPNGLALCKIHHSAYDANILGISPEYRVALRQDVLEESDGPVHEYGLKRLDGEPLRVLPSRAADRPDRALLDARFDAFLKASRRFQNAADVAPVEPPTQILFRRK